MTTVVFLTDSIGLVPEADAATRYPAICADRLGWTETVRGLSGSGYLADGVENLTFADVVQDDVIAHNPDVVVVEGGYNDFAQGKTLAATQAAMASLLATLRAGLPSAVICVLGMWIPHTPSAVVDGSVNASSEVAFNAGMAVAAAGFVFHDLSGWITGTGAAEAPAGDGNADAYIRGDGTDPHPTTAGAAYFGVRLAHAINPPATGLDY